MCPCKARKYVIANWLLVCSAVSELAIRTGQPRMVVQTLFWARKPVPEGTAREKMTSQLLIPPSASLESWDENLGLSDILLCFVFNINFLHGFKIKTYVLI